MLTQGVVEVGLDLPSFISKVLVLQLCANMPKNNNNNIHLPLDCGCGLATECLFSMHKALV